MPSSENLNPTHEVLHCDKPGTGCNDAPRGFSLKLSKVTRDLCGMDNELCFLHEPEPEPTTSADTESREAAGKSRKLLAIMAKHVDDLKITGEQRQ